MGFTPERARAVLEERARRLARSPEKPVAPGGSMEALIFRLGPERYGIGTGFVREVTRTAEVTPVPGSSEFFAGVANLRGQVLPVVDLRRLLGLPAGPAGGRFGLVVLGVDRAEFGVLVDAAEETVSLRPEEVRRPLGRDGEADKEFIRGVTEDARILLDGERLLKDRRLNLSTATREPEGRGESHD